MEYDVNKFAMEAMGSIKGAYQSMKAVNIMLLGKSGVGKSTLINNVFSEHLADTGIGKPITQQIKKITKENFPLAIYDTPGIELGGENALNSLMEQVKKEIKNGVDSGDVERAIHCIWYCVSTASHRFEQAEIDFLKKFLETTDECNVPVIIILTQSFAKNDAKALKAEIEKENLSVANIVPVLAQDYDIDEEYIAKAYGLDKLVEITSDVIPDGVQNAFAAVQKVSLNLKIKRAQTVVAASASIAAATGAVPIPFADAAVLVPEQIAMLAGITTAFGLPIEKGVITAIISSTIGTSGATILGKTIVTNLIKLIPGAGSAVGAVISGATAAALTTALGEAYIIIMTMICKGELSTAELSTEDGKEKIQNIFTEQLKLKRKPNGEVAEKT